MSVLFSSLESCGMDVIFQAGEFRSRCLHKLSCDTCSNTAWAPSIRLHVLTCGRHARAVDLPWLKPRLMLKAQPRNEHVQSTGIVCDVNGLPINYKSSCDAFVAGTLLSESVFFHRGRLHTSAEYSQIYAFHFTMHKRCATPILPHTRLMFTGLKPRGIRCSADW